MPEGLTQGGGVNIVRLPPHPSYTIYKYPSMTKALQEPTIDKNRDLDEGQSDREDPMVRMVSLLYKLRLILVQHLRN